MNHTKLHKRLTWFWVIIIPVSFVLRESVMWIVFMSHYAIIASHWSATEAAD